MIEEIALSHRKEAAAEAHVDGYPPAPMAWYLVGVLVVGAVLSFVDRQILALLVQPVRRDLGISDTALSILQGFAFTILYSLVGLPLGRHVDRANRRNLVAVGVLFWSLATMGCGFAQSYAQLFVMRIGVGIGEAVLAPAAYSMISDTFRPKRRGTALGVYSSAIYLGAGAAVVIGGAVLALIRERTEVALPVFGVVRSWQAAFLCVGLPGLVVAPLVLTLREPRRDGARALRGVPATQDGATHREDLRYFVEHRSAFAPQCAAYAFTALAAYGIATWAPTFFVRTYHMTPADAALRYGAAVCVFGTSGGVLGGIAADKWLAAGRADARITLSIIAALCWIPLIVGGTHAGNARTSLALLGLASFFSGVVNCLGPTTIQDIVPGALRGQATALFFFVLNLFGIGLGPTAIALVTDHVFHEDAALYHSIPTVTVPAILAGVMLFVVARKPYRALRAELYATRPR
ncbi:MAG TPA: MFS transporter [Polyangiaceae bacterium]|nr:MFS transporter [Polyangiaceae bacterium]